MANQLVKPNNLVQTIERANAILDILAQNPQGYSIKAISEAISLPKGTTHRLVSSLAYFGYVRQDLRTRDYYLGFKLVELGNLLLGQLDLRREAEPFLQELASRLGETVHLVVLDGREIVYIDKKETDRQKSGLRMASRIGLRNPLHSCAVGKVISAFMPEGTLAALLKDYRFLKRTANTIGDAAAFREHLRQVRACGYAIDEEENEKGIRCVAAPIFNEAGQVVAAVSISGPSFQVTRKIVEESYSREVMAVAQEISGRLGYQARAWIPA
jgi:DNA-binding IclR family transcriptional regulator